jgi:hypothetical protein
MGDMWFIFAGSPDGRAAWILEGDRPICERTKTCWRQGVGCNQDKICAKGNKQVTTQYQLCLAVVAWGLLRHDEVGQRKGASVALLGGQRYV